MSNLKLIAFDYQRFREIFDERAINEPERQWMLLLRFLRMLDSLLWRLQGCTEVLCCGDSHVAVLRRLNGRFRKARFVVNSVRGATALGIVNPNSKSNAMEIFDEFLRRSSCGQELIFCMGEVDCGFLIWLLADKRGQSVDELMEEAIHCYTSFITRHRHQRRVAVISAPLPTIADGEERGRIANLRKAVSASQRQRTELTLEFNRRMRDWCAEHRVVFVGLDRLSMDPETGMVREYLLNSNLSDHHYEPARYIELLEKSDLASLYV